MPATINLREQSAGPLATAFSRVAPPGTDAYAQRARHVRSQAYVENMLDATYYVTAHNDNISPGSRRTVRVSFVSGF
jgi:hypothetical protein